MLMIREALPFDFVVSYNQENQDAASEVLDQLESFGLKGWIDERYYYTPTVPLEQQIAKAWAKARFIVLLAPPGFRDSEWCRTEYGQGLAAEHELPLQQVLVLRGENDADIPESLKHHPSFVCGSPDELHLAAQHIKERRRCLREGQDLPALAVRRLQRVFEALLHEQWSIEPSVYSQLNVVSIICSWVAEKLAPAQFEVNENVSVTMHEVIEQESVVLCKQDFLDLVFSDSVKVDRFPFQRALFDTIFFGHNLRKTARSETVDRLVWDQLLILSCVSNRYFQLQMLERAELIAEETRFCLFDEDAQNHFCSLGAASWTTKIGRNAFLKPVADNVRGSSKLLATLCEHVLLKNWQKERLASGKFISQIPRPERIRLATKSFLLLTAQFQAGDSSHLAPDFAVTLGLCAPGPRVNVHASPSLALELFYWTLETILGRGAFTSRRQDLVNRLKLEISDSGPSDLVALQAAVAAIVPSYIGYVRSAAERRGNQHMFELPSAIPERDFLAFWDFLLAGPLSLLAQTGIDLGSLRPKIIAALNVFLAQGDNQTKAYAAVAAANIDRLDKYDKLSCVFLLQEIQLGKSDD